MGYIKIDYNFGGKMVSTKRGIIKILLSDIIMSIV